MRKTDRKLDNAVCQALTEVCEWAQLEIRGFEWITHTADFKRFPDSLQITCVFNVDNEVEQLKQGDNERMLLKEIQRQLQQAGIYLRDIEKHVSLDSEEACEQQHGGNWKRRLSS